MCSVTFSPFNPLGLLSQEADLETDFWAAGLLRSVPWSTTCEGGRASELTRERLNCDVLGQIPQMMSTGSAGDGATYLSKVPGLCTAHCPGIGWRLLSGKGEAAPFAKSQTQERTHLQTICSQHSWQPREWMSLSLGGSGQLTTASTTVHPSCCLDPFVSYSPHLGAVPPGFWLVSFSRENYQKKLVGQTVAPVTTAGLEAKSGSHHLPFLLSIHVHFISILCSFLPLLAPVLV